MSLVHVTPHTTHHAHTHVSPPGLTSTAIHTSPTPSSSPQRLHTGHAHTTRTPRCTTPRCTTPSCTTLPLHSRRRLALFVWPTSRTAGASEQAVLSTAVGFVVKPQMKHFFFPFGAPSLPLSGQNADHAGVSLVFRIAQGSTRASARICEPSFSLSLVPCTGEALVWSVLGLR